MKFLSITQPIHGSSRARLRGADLKCCGLWKTAMAIGAADEIKLFDKFSTAFPKYNIKYSKSRSYKVRAFFHHIASVRIKSSLFITQMHVEVFISDLIVS